MPKLIELLFAQEIDGIRKHPLLSEAVLQKEVRLLTIEDLSRMNNVLVKDQPTGVFPEYISEIAYRILSNRAQVLKLPIFETP